MLCPEPDLTAEGYYSPAQTCRLTSLSRSTIERRAKAGTFPKAVALGDQRIGYKVLAVKAWLSAPSSWRPILRDGTG